MQGVERSGHASTSSRKFKAAASTAFSKTAFWICTEDIAPHSSSKKQHSSKRKAKFISEDKENGKCLPIKRMLHLLYPT